MADTDQKHIPNTNMRATIHTGDCIESMKAMPEKSVHCCVTSPPYFGLRDYDNDRQIGLEETPEAYISKLVSVFREVKRVLRDDGTLWLNLGDSYAGSGKGPAGNLGAKHNERHLEHKHGGIVPDGLKPKDLIGIPWKVAFALQADGWYLRQDIIWHKPNPMPESVRDRCTKAHEYIFLFSKSRRYYFDSEAVKEPTVQSEAGLGNETRNRRSVWSVNLRPYKGAHFATFPPDLIRPCVRAGCPIGGVVLDPFAGSGTTAQVALEEGRLSVLCELNPSYVKLIEERLAPLLC